MLTQKNELKKEKEMRKLEVFYLVVFFMSIGGFCFSNISFKQVEHNQQKGVSWHCHKCGRYVWKQEPPYVCSNCGCEKGKIK